MRPELHFISGWGVPVSAWQGLAAAVEPLVRLVVHDASAWMEAPALPPEGAYLGGWSLGGQLAVKAAAGGDRWRGLILCSTTARFCRGDDQAWGTPPRHLERMRRRFEDAPAEVLHSFYTLCAEPHVPGSGNPDRWAGEALEAGAARLAEGLRFLAEEDLREAAADIALPTILLHGREDRVIPAEAGTWLARHLPDARCTVHDGEGHDLPLRRPDPLADAIAELAGQAR